MQKNKILKSTIIFLTLANFIIFIFRDHFQFQLYSNYSSLYGECDKNCIKKWQQTVHDYSKKEISEARLITQSELRLKDKSTLSKVTILGSFIYSRFEGQNGSTSPVLQSISPLQQYKKLCSSDTLKLMCGQFAQIFSFFCWSEGITNRTIEIINPGDHHVVNECYIPEKKQWVLVDLTTNQLLLQDEKKNFLNLLDFKKNLEQSSPVLVWKANNDSIQQEQLDFSSSYITTYYLKNNPLIYYYQTDNNKVYQLHNKIKRYFFPITWYEIFETNDHTNLFFIKGLLIILWVIFISLFLINRKNSSRNFP
jgi:hypothetical protein